MSATSNYSAIQSHVINKVAALIGFMLCVAVGGFFALFWRLTGGIGFSDVRLMACVGAITAAASIDLAIAATLAGTILGACWGLLRRVLGRSGQFAYGPALWAGPFLALLLAQLPSTQL